MIRLNLTAAPAWLTLAPGFRINVAPLTTALMVSARADPAIEALPDAATQEELALAMAKAVARRAVLDWEGVGDDAGNIKKQRALRFISKAMLIAALVFCADPCQGKRLARKACQ